MSLYLDIQQYLLQRSFDTNTSYRQAGSLAQPFNCSLTRHSSLIPHHSSLITHHSISHHSISPYKSRNSHPPNHSLYPVNQPLSQSVSQLVSYLVSRFS
jgi:hypothetical protein